MASVNVPRIVVAATGSGAGKTTVTTGLIAALRARGLKVAPFKCGPDYLDPGYHALAAGAVSHNLDGWMMGREGVLETFARASRGADIAVVEGMMGLFDSAAPTADEGSTAEIARWLDAPVLLVADVSGMARTIGALALGFSRFDPSIRLGGLIGNRVGSRGHLELLREAAPLIPILGGLPSNPTIAIPERHLGLRSALAEAVSAPLIESLQMLIEEWFDIDALLTLARSAPLLDVFDAPSTGRSGLPQCRIGVAYDEAFHFYYEYNLARLEELGAEIVRFSPIHDRLLPGADGLYFGGGYPEVGARQLAANRSMIEAVRAFAAAGGPIYSECGGLMYLAEGIRTLDKVTFPMVGLIPGTAVMHDTMQALGYAAIETTAPSFLGPAGTRWRGHQFRYSTLEPPPADVERIYQVTPRWGAAPFAEGLRRGSVIASYVHAHWASNPDVPASLVHVCTKWRTAQLRGSLVAGSRSRL